MMRKMLVILAILALCVSSAPAQDDAGAAAYRLLQAENKLLKAQLKARKAKYGLGPATSKPTTRRAGSGKTFSLSEDDPAWWRDPAALALQIRLRDLVGPAHPLEAPEPWMIRNKFLVGRELNWSVQIYSITAVTETAAGQKYFAGRQVLDAQRKQIESLKDQVRTAGTPERKAQALRSLVDAEFKLAAAEAENKQWKRLLEFKGGTVLRAIHRERRKGNYANVIEVTVALPAGEEKKLNKYKEDKRVQHPQSRQSYWPVRVTGKVVSVLYDGRTIRVAVEGKWAPVQGDGLTKVSAKPTRLIPAASAGHPGYVGVRY